MSQPIILYDLPNALSLEKRSYSANTVRTRLILNYKSIPYKTVWIEFADIQKGLKELGAPPTGTLSDGVTPRYSVPTIYDPNTGKFVGDSLEISKYLDTQYPVPGRQVIPTGAEQLVLQYVQSAFKALGAVFPLMVTRVWGTLPARSQPTFNDTLVPFIGGGPPFSERPPASEADLQEFCATCRRLASGMNEVNTELRAAGKYQEDGLNLAEICVLSFLKMFQAITSDEEFSNILEQDDRRLRALWERGQPYLITDEGEWYQLKE